MATAVHSDLDLFTLEHGKITAVKTNLKENWYLRVGFLGEGKGGWDLKYTIATDMLY